MISRRHYAKSQSSDLSLARLVWSPLIPQLHQSHATFSSPSCMLISRRAITVPQWCSTQQASSAVLRTCMLTTLKDSDNVDSCEVLLQPALAVSDARKSGSAPSASVGLRRILSAFAAVQTFALFTVGKVSSADPHSILYHSVYSYSLIVLSMPNIRILS